MDYNYTELNPVVFLTVFYKDKDKYVEIGVIITRKLNLHKLREKIKQCFLALRRSLRSIPLKGLITPKRSAGVVVSYYPTQ